MDGLLCSPEYPQHTQYLTCPNVASGVAGTCVQACSGDSDCTSGQKCCSNGCGRSCVDADQVPYYNVSTQQCPDTSGLIGICVVGCRGDYDCDNRQMCCSNGCGQTCSASTTISQRCLHVRSQFNSTTIALGLPIPPLGAFIPRCDSDGNYSPLQYFEGYSWCVHTQTGLPLSGFYGRGEMAQCRSESIHNLDAKTTAHIAYWLARLVTRPVVSGCKWVVFGCGSGHESY